MSRCSPGLLKEDVSYKRLCHLNMMHNKRNCPITSKPLHTFLIGSLLIKKYLSKKIVLLSMASPHLSLATVHCYPSSKHSLLGSTHSIQIFVPEKRNSSLVSKVKSDRCHPQKMPCFDIHCHFLGVLVSLQSSD